jgi:hypothetical protein
LLGFFVRQGNCFLISIDKILVEFSD